MISWYDMSSINRPNIKSKSVFCFFKKSHHVFGKASVIEIPVFFNFFFTKTFLLVLELGNLTIIGLDLLLPDFGLPILWVRSSSFSVSSNYKCSFIVRKEISSVFSSCVSVIPWINIQFLRKYCFWWTSWFSRFLTEVLRSGTSLFNSLIILSFSRLSLF